MMYVYVYMYIYISTYIVVSSALIWSFSASPYAPHTCDEIKDGKAYNMKMRLV